MYMLYALLFTYKVFSVEHTMYMLYALLFTFDCNYENGCYDLKNSWKCMLYFKLILILSLLLFPYKPLPEVYMRRS